MTERQIFLHDVVVPAPFATLRQVAGSFEIVDEVGRRSFRDPDGFSDVPEAGAGVGGDDLKYVGMVRYEPEKVV
jgi:hypothetical protein